MTDIGHNNPPRCADEKEALRAYGNLGSAAAAGALKGAEFLELVAENVRNQLHEVSPKKAQEVWGAFRNAQLRKLGNLTVDSEASTEANFKQRASNVCTVMIAAAKPGVDLNDIFARARPMIVDAKAKGESKMNTWDGFVAIAVAQKAKTEPLSDADIASAIRPKAKEASDYNEKIALERALHALKVLVKGTEATEKSPGKEAFPSERACGALQLIEEQITLLEFKSVQAKVNAIPQFNLIKKA